MGIFARTFSRAQSMAAYELPEHSFITPQRDIVNSEKAKHQQEMISPDALRNIELAMSSPNPIPVVNSISTIPPKASLAASSTRDVPRTHPPKVSALTRTLSSVRDASRFRRNSVRRRHDNTEDKPADVSQIALDRIHSANSPNMLKDSARHHSVVSPRSRFRRGQSSRSSIDDLRSMVSMAQAGDIEAVAVSRTPSRVSVEESRRMNSLASRSNSRAFTRRASSRVSQGEIRGLSALFSSKASNVDFSTHTPDKSLREGGANRESDGRSSERKRAGKDRHRSRGDRPENERSKGKNPRRAFSAFGRTMSLTRLHSRTKFEKNPNQEKAEEPKVTASDTAIDLDRYIRDSDLPTSRAAERSGKNEFEDEGSRRNGQDLAQLAQEKKTDVLERQEHRDRDSLSKSTKRPRHRGLALTRSLSRSSPSSREAPALQRRSSRSAHRVSSSSSTGPSPRSSPLLQRLRSYKRFSRTLSRASSSSTRETSNDQYQSSGRSSESKDTKSDAEGISGNGASRSASYVAAQQDGQTITDVHQEGARDTKVEGYEQRQEEEPYVELDLHRYPISEMTAEEAEYQTARDLSALIAQVDSLSAASGNINSTVTTQVWERVGGGYKESSQRGVIDLAQSPVHSGGYLNQPNSLQNEPRRPPPMVLEEPRKRPPPISFFVEKSKPPALQLVQSESRPPSLSMFGGGSAETSSGDDEERVFGSTGDFSSGGFRITAQGMVSIQKRITRMDSDNHSSDDPSPPSSQLVIIKDLTEFRKGRALGAGVSGRVYLTKHVPTGKLIAMKVVNVYDEGKRVQLLKELETLTTHVSRFLVRFYGAFYDGSGAVHIALEYMDRGCLASAVLKCGPVPECITRMIAHDCLRGLRFLHHNRVIHRDFKTGNILLSRRLCRAKIADFGLARDVNPEISNVDTFVGTMAYMSPERLQGGKYTYASDIWALGVSIAECLLGKYPFDKPTTYFDYIESTKTEDILNSDVPGKRFSRYAKHFVKVCTDLDADRRPTAEELMDHPWIKARERDPKLFAQWLDHVITPKSSARMKQL